MKALNPSAPDRPARRVTRGVPRFAALVGTVTLVVLAVLVAAGHGDAWPAVTLSAATVFTVGMLLMVASAEPDS